MVLVRESLANYYQLYVSSTPQTKIHAFRAPCSDSMYMLMERSATLVASSNELGRASDLLGVHIDLTGFFPEPLGTVFEARVVITHCLPSTDSDLFL
jgi:hypothetical protein